MDARAGQGQPARNPMWPSGRRGGRPTTVPAPLLRPLGPMAATLAGGHHGRAACHPIHAEFFDLDTKNLTITMAGQRYKLDPGSGAMRQLFSWLRSSALKVAATEVLCINHLQHLRGGLRPEIYVVAGQRHSAERLSLIRGAL